MNQNGNGKKEAPSIYAVAITPLQALDMAELLQQSAIQANLWAQAHNADLDDTSILIYCADEDAFSVEESEKLVARYEKAEKNGEQRLSLAELPPPDFIFVGEVLIVGVPAGIGSFVEE